MEKKSRGRPAAFPIKKLIAIDETLLDAIEKYRADQSPIPNESEAFRQLLRDQLIAGGYLKWKETSES